MNAAQLNALEARLRHYPDDSGVGLILARTSFAVLDPSGNLLVIGANGNDSITVNTNNAAAVAVAMNRSEERRVGKECKSRRHTSCLSDWSSDVCSSDL